MTSWQTTTYASQWMLPIITGGSSLLMLSQLMKLTHHVASGRRLCIHSCCSTKTGCHASGEPSTNCQSIFCWCASLAKLHILSVSYQGFEQPACTMLELLTSPTFYSYEWCLLLTGRNIATLSWIAYSRALGMLSHAESTGTSVALDITMSTDVVPIHNQLHST